jgi:hypothetical protein
MKTLMTYFKESNLSDEINKHRIARCQWLMSVILVTWETEIGRIIASPGYIVSFIILGVLCI